MLDAVLNFLSHGLLGLSWWAILGITLILTHITMASVTIFLHRHQAHRALDLHALPSHFFRFWLWMTTGMETKQWAAIHRKHHAHCETENDPHSPQIFGLKKVLWQGAELYRKESKNQETLEKFGRGTPDDWIEQKIYSKYSALGVSLMLIIDVLLFGVVGLTVWAIQMVWTPFFAAGVINGVAHYVGYRNFACDDASTNIFPWGILIAGEELHNNHHTYGTSAKLSVKPWEFDIGWMYIRILSMLGLATVRKTIPKPTLIEGKKALDLGTLQAIIANRYDVTTRFAHSVKALCADELAKIKAHTKLPELNLQKVTRKISSDAKLLADKEKQELQAVLEHSNTLHTIHTMRQELSQLWARSSASTEQLVEHLQDWCARAEASGIAALKDFSLRLRTYA